MSEAQMTKLPEIKRRFKQGASSFVIRASFVILVSTFVIPFETWCAYAC